MLLGLGTAKNGHVHDEIRQFEGENTVSGNVRRSVGGEWRAREQRRGLCCFVASSRVSQITSFAHRKSCLIHSATMAMCRWSRFFSPVHIGKEA